jgi:hypothetical protein
LESGLLFLNNKIRLDYFRPGIGSVIVDSDLHMISVPLYAKYTFLKYLFLQGGVSLDLQTNYSNDSNLDKQSGLGLEFGFGGKVNFGKVSLFLNPFYSNHAINAHNNLMEAGAKFGLGYNF